MADITPKVRLANSHSYNHLTSGHFGRPVYDAPAEAWDFLRESQVNEERDQEAEPRQLGLILEHSEIVGASELPLDAPELPLEVPQRLPDREFAVRLASNAIASESRAFSDSAESQKTSAYSLDFGYAVSEYEVGHHGLSLPIIVWAGAHESMLNVAFYTSGIDEETEHVLSQLEPDSYRLSAPSAGVVLGLCFSPDKNFLAVRQMSGTSIVMLVHGQTAEAPSTHSVDLKHIVTLPQTATGCHQHADVAFHPRNRHQFGIVDTHGNWSIWQLLGRRSQSSRILHKAKLHASGKLVPSKANLKHFGNNLFFDGWYRICCLERSPSIYALLICSRRIARTFDLDGSALGDVDMRLGRSAARNWILETQSSLHHSGTCFVLTSTHLQVMRLPSVMKKTDDLDLLCSWPHYRDGSKLTLTLRVIDTPQATCLVLCAPGTALQLFWVRWSDQELHACDPQFLAVPEPDQTAIGVVTIIPNDIVSGTLGLASRGLVHVVLSSSNGPLHSLVYSVNGTSRLDSGTLQAQDALILAPPRDRRFKSSRVVEDDDDLLDFVVADGFYPSDAAQTSDEPRRGSQVTSRTTPSKPAIRTRNWADIINLQLQHLGPGTIEHTMTEIQGRSARVPTAQTSLSTLSEVLPETLISDIEAASGSLAELEHLRQDNGISEPDDITSQRWRRNVLSVDSLLERYDGLFSRYVRHLSAQVPERTKVQTERLCRDAAFDECTSHIIKEPREQSSTADLLPSIGSLTMQSSPPSSPPPSSEAHQPSEAPPLRDASVLDVLKRYTSIKDETVKDLASTTVKNVLSHFPDELSDPNSYSYKAVEDDLNKSRTQQEMDAMDDRARRKAERAALKEERRKQRQSNIRNAVARQSTLVPGLVMSSPQRDPREVQSSQLVPIAVASSQPGLPMTQPERGTHGERRRPKKEGKHRIKGF